MTDGVFTEREWLRKGGGMIRSSPCYWGALCTRPPAGKNIHRNHKLHAVMLVVSLVFAATFNRCFSCPPKPVVFPLAAVPASAAGINLRQVPGLTYDAPVDCEMRTLICTDDELYCGKLLQLDPAHPLPVEASKASAENIATFGKGMVPVNDLSLVTGKETIEALAELFALLRENGVGCFAVWRGMENEETMAERLHTQIQAMAKTVDLNTAVARFAHAGYFHEDWQLPYTVALCMPSADPEIPDRRALEETPQGRKLLQLAWQCGFVRSGEGEEAFRFRYVGRAHATAITYLDVSLSEYLEILQEKKNITIRTKESTYYIQCIAAPDHYVQFRVPAAAAVDVSADNTGYAIAACTVDGGV